MAGPTSVSSQEYHGVCGERATASSSPSHDDAMSVTSWRRSDNEIDAAPPLPFGLMGNDPDFRYPLGKTAAQVRGRFSSLLFCNERPHAHTIVPT